MVNLGSVCTGTLSTPILVAVFADVFRNIGAGLNVASADADKWRRHESALRRADAWLTLLDDFSDADDDGSGGATFASVGAALLDELFDALDAFAPPGAYFGAHPGDGADFGYWPNEDEDSPDRRNADRIDGYDRDDIGESPDY